MRLQHPPPEPPISSEAVLTLAVVAAISMLIGAAIALLSMHYFF